MKAFFTEVLRNRENYLKVFNILMQYIYIHNHLEILVIKYILQD